MENHHRVRDIFKSGKLNNWEEQEVSHTTERKVSQGQTREVTASEFETQRMVRKQQFRDWTEVPGRKQPAFRGRPCLSRLFCAQCWRLRRNPKSSFTSIKTIINVLSNITQKPTGSTKTGALRSQTVSKDQYKVNKVTKRVT